MNRLFQRHVRLSFSRHNKTVHLETLPNAGIDEGGHVILLQVHLMTPFMDLTNPDQSKVLRSQFI